MILIFVVSLSIIGNIIEEGTEERIEDLLLENYLIKNEILMFSFVNYKLCHLTVWLTITEIIGL